MAANEAAGASSSSSRPPPPPPHPPPRPTLSLPPRSAVEGLFAAASEISPGPLTVAASLFPGESPSSSASLFHGSFTQLLVGAVGSPAGLSPAGFSPSALLASPGLFSPVGNFEMSHQQALAQVTAQAAHPQHSMLSQADCSSSFSLATSALTSQYINSSVAVTSVQEMLTVPLHRGNCNIETTEVSQGLQTSSVAVDKPADDGYNWRKYGQKAVKGGEYPRSYYKCTHLNCPVKKKVERSADGQISQIIYRGQHNHERPPKRRSKDGGDLLNESDDLNENEDASTRAEPGSQDYSGKFERSNDGMLGPSMSRRGDGGEQLSGSSDSEEDGDDEVRNNDGNIGHANEIKRNVPASAQRIIVQTTSEVDLLDDGYRWRKYGQKVVKGNPHPRSYYKCTYQGCDVKKHIERSSQDPKAVITTYEGKHDHDLPAARNSSHATANANMSSSSSLAHRGQNTASSSQPLLRQIDLYDSRTSDSALQLKGENEMT